MTRNITNLERLKTYIENTYVGSLHDICKRNYSVQLCDKLYII